MKDVIYLDYSASTPVDKKILDKFYFDNLELVGNSNSIHKLGRDCKEKIEEASYRILSSFSLSDDYEIVYTSGATEANNLAIKGLVNRFKNGRIITSSFEHSSVVAPLGYLQKKGFIVDVVKCNDDGQIDLSDLESMMSSDVVLVTIASVNSEIGIYQQLEEIKRIVKKYPNVILHMDMTQCVGKMAVNYNGIDMFSYSAHKIYGFKGIGALIKKKNIRLECQIQGGSSTTKYRSGTPVHPLIISLANSTVDCFCELQNKYKKVEELNKYFISKLSRINNVLINSNDKCIPHILNVSFLGYESKYIVLELEKNNIYISNHSACSSNDEMSKAVYALTSDEERAKSSVRFSISHLTTRSELDKVIEVLEKLI